MLLENGMGASPIDLCQIQKYEEGEDSDPNNNGADALRLLLGI